MGTFCQMLQRVESDYRTLISSGLFLDADILKLSISLDILIFNEVLVRLNFFVTFFTFFIHASNTIIFRSLAPTFLI